MRINNFLLREVITILICVLAASIGPYLWINAVYKPFFTLGGFGYSIICLLIYQGITVLDKMFSLKTSQRLASITGISIGTILLFFLTYLMRNQLFEIDNGIALLNYPITIILVISFIVINYLVEKGFVNGLYRVSIYFLLPLVIIFLLLPLIPNGEGQVLLGNVAVVYYLTKEFTDKVIKNNRLSK